MSKNQYRVILALVVLLVISFPFVLGFLKGDSRGQFGGFLINPIDGNSYLAKMQQGYEGEWKFQLPYTAESGEGAYLFSFYLLLGHIGRVTNIPLIYVFHCARILSAAWLLFAMSQMLQDLYNDHKTYKVGLLLAYLGSGLGWLAVLAGAFTSDFWVAEAYPFLSMYTNPHFSLGLGLMIYSLRDKNQEKLFSSLIAGVFLGIIQPFAVVIVSLVKLIYSALKIIQERNGLKSLLRSRLVLSTLLFCLAGGLIVLYQFWAILSDPVLSQWHQQNITVKPKAWDLVLSLSPCLVLSLIGARRTWEKDTGRTLLIWGAVCLVLVFIPWSLQRRFLAGIFFPIAAVSVLGLEVISEVTKNKFRHLAIITIFLAVPTNIIVITSGVQAIVNEDPQIYLDQGFMKALSWITLNTEQDALVLAEEGEGLYVPSLTGRRVIYGHPFETINAESEKELLNEIYSGSSIDSFYNDVFESRGVDYVLIDDSQGESVSKWLINNWELIYQSDETRIYARPDQ